MFIFEVEIGFCFNFCSQSFILFQMALDQSQNQSILDDSLSTTTTQSIQQKHAHGSIVRIRLENFM